MRVLRLVTHGGAEHLRLVDERDGSQVLDVLRVEFAPLELHDRRWFATLVIHERGADGEPLSDKDEHPITRREFVELRVGTIWSV